VTRVLVVQNMYPPHHYGGYELSCRDVVDRWRRRGHDVEVLTSTLRVSGVDDLPDEQGIRRVLPIAFAEGDLTSPPLWRRPELERRSLRELRTVLAEAQPDVVSLWHMAALSFGMLSVLVESGIPLVFVVCDDWLSYGAKIDPWMRLFLGRPALARAAGRVTGLPTTVPDLGQLGTFCFVSEVTRQRSLTYTSWTYPDSTVTYSGVDLDDFPLVTERDDGWQWRLLHVGRLDERKGIETAIRALALLPAEATLELLGRGDPAYRARLEALTAELGLSDRVRFDVVERRALHDRYKQADAFVFPTDWDEPFGLVPLEAMACGTPVVATGSGGSGEFLFDGHNCLRFPPGDAAALAAALRRLAGDPALRQRLRSGGTATVSELTVDRLSEVLEEWHVAAAGHFAGGRPAHRPAVHRPPVG
jgi:glycosyltransferase involved in cell wall biosynthesis